MNCETGSSWRVVLEGLPTSVLVTAWEGLKAQVELYRLYNDEHIEELKVEMETSEQVTSCINRNFVYQP